MVKFPEDDSFELTPGPEIWNKKTEFDFSDPGAEAGIMTLPVDFKITTGKDIEVLNQYLRFKYSGKTILFRGHESVTYQLASTLARNIKEDKKTSEDIAEIEHQSLELFDKSFDKEWEKCRPQKVNVELFKLSIARHLGMSCRLIDFTASIETAIFFAVHNHRFFNENGELIVLIFDKNDFIEPDNISFTEEVYYLHEPFLCNRFDELPLGELDLQRDETK